MKVCHLTTVDLSLYYLVFPQLTAIVDLGSQAVGISAPGPWVANLEAAGIRHVPLAASTRGVSPLNDLRAARQLWRVLKQENPDVLHTHNPKPGVYGRILGRLAGVPVVVNTVHGLYATEDDSWLKRALVYAVEAIAARFSDAELVQSSEDLDSMRRLRIAPPARLVALGNGIDLDRFDPDRADLPDRREIRQNLGIGPTDIVVGMVGRLVAEKGYPELFEAAVRLGDGYTVLAIGPEDADKPDALPSDLLDAGVAAGVRLLGMRTDMDQLYRAMDLLVLPSHREGFPRAAMEAAAMKLPVVATDIRGCREVVEEGVNGFLIPVGNPAALTAAIRRLGEDPGMRKRMGEAGRRKARDSFDERLIVATVLATYRSVAYRKDLRGLAAALGQAGVGTQRSTHANASDELRLRPARIMDAPVLARMHMDSIPTGFLPRLGDRFMRVLYRALITWKDATVLVADVGFGPVGFVAGVVDTRAFYRHFIQRYGLPAVGTALPALTRWSTIRRARETARYGSTNDAEGGELLSMAVDPERRGRGIGSRLGTAFLEDMQRRGLRSVTVVVGAENRTAIRAYERLGFLRRSTMQIHPGEPSEVMEWSG